MGFTPEEYEELGRHWLRIVGTAVAMGHNSAASVAEYVDPTDLPPLAALVRDSFAAARTDDLGREARARTIEFVNSTDVLEQIADAVTR